MAIAATRDLKLLKGDLAFGMIGVFGVFGLFREASKSTEAIAASANPILSGTIAIVLAIALGLIIVILANLDRKNSEEFVFQIITNSAVVAIMTALFGTLLLGSEFLLGQWVNEPSANTVISLLMAGWSLGYFRYRIRGGVA